MECSAVNVCNCSKARMPYLDILSKSTLVHSRNLESRIATICLCIFPSYHQSKWHVSLKTSNEAVKSTQKTHWETWEQKDIDVIWLEKSQILKSFFLDVQILIFDSSLMKMLSVDWSKKCFEKKWNYFNFIAQKNGWMKLLFGQKMGKLWHFSGTTIKLKS